MLNRPTQSSHKETHFQKSKHNPNQVIHHGTTHSRLLLDVPSETLLGITSYLDPPSLFALARVHGRLNEHTKDDNTWHRAFVCQFLGIGPESDIKSSAQTLMLRRSESTWRKEFIFRYKLKRRWERSRNSTIAHIPVNSEISGIYLMPGDSLLTSSIQYGIVSRSLPFSGKILSGYIDASGAHFGLGLGNPNAEFTPNVSACALMSDGGTAKVLWGFRHGEVAITTVPRAMDGYRRPMTELVRCDAREQHEGPVLDVCWDDASVFVGSAGADGRVKLWDPKTVRCLWTSETSERNTKALESEAYAKIKLSASQGFIVAITRSGEIVFWTGFEMQSTGAFSAMLAKQVHVACPVVSTETQRSNKADAHEILAVHIDPYASFPTVLVAYQSDPFFYRIRVEGHRATDIGRFGDTSFGPISSITPCFSRESSFVLTGDHIGCVSVYDWRSGYHPALPVRKFEAHGDMAGVSAIAWDGVTLITGSANGTTHAWDALTFESLRSFASPLSRVRGGRGGAIGNAGGDRDRKAVRQILVGPGKEAMLVSVGDRVLAWKAGPAPQHNRGGVRGRYSSGSLPKKKRDGHGLAKYYQQVELNQTIFESRLLLQQESEYFRKANGREREHRHQLESMGLSEVEAVEYVTMLSRDEAMKAGKFCQEEGVFEGDFESTSSLARSLNSAAASTSSARSSTNMLSKNGRPIPRSSLSKSGRKFQVSPPRRVEPMEGDVHYGSSSSQSQSGSDVTSDESHFPSISASSSSVASSPAASITGSGPGVSSRGSPQSIRSGGTSSSSAWNTPLMSVRRLSGTCTSPMGSEVALPGSRPYPQGAGGGNFEEGEMDEELRFALELSLAEAMSRGEDV